MTYFNSNRSLLCTLWWCFTAVAAAAQANTKEVIIISTNDIHGRIENFAKMAAYVKKLKKANPDVFVFNGGDLINGNPVVDEAKDKGSPIIDLMNQVPYTISCLGNHEFENGEAVLQRRIIQSTSVFVGANINVNAPSPLNPLKPYHILHTSDGISIAILGLTASSSNPCLIPNITVTDPVKKALAYQWLRDSCDILMALTHIGYKQDSTLATKMKELDVIVGGHSHTEIPHGLVVNGVLITQAGDKLRFIGKTTFKIKDHKIVDKSFEMISFSSLTAIDTAVQQKINFYNHNSFSHVVAKSTTGFMNKEELGSLKADALAKTLNLDIAFDHARNVSYSSFPKGKITLRDIYEIDSYDYQTIRYQLNGAQLKTLILNSMKKTMVPVLFVSGLTYTVNLNTHGEAIDVTLKNKNGLLDETKTYSVGMNSFIACHFMPADVTGTPLKTTTADCMLHYFKLHPVINYAHVHRAFVNSL